MAGLPPLTGFRKVAFATVCPIAILVAVVSVAFAQEDSIFVESGLPGCVRTSGDFFYGTDTYFDTPFAYDSMSWEPIVTIPYTLSPLGSANYIEHLGYYVGLVRKTDEDDAVWVRTVVETDSTWAILTRDAMTWEEVSTKPVEYMSVFRLFQGPDNSVWGLNTPLHLWNLTPPETMPMFSRFNEETRQFEPYVDGPEMQRFGKSRQVYDGSYGEDDYYFLVAPDGLIWVFRHFDGVYRYDPATNSETKIIEAGPGDAYRDMAVSHEGVVYYSIPKAEVIDQHRGERKQGDVDIYRIDPETLTVSQVPPPDLDWPLHNGMIVDRDGHLWLGTIARQNDDLSWERVGEPSRPFPFYASSDGRLWFLRMNDYSSYQGTGWIDPATGEACWLTTFPALVFEDRSRNLWMVARGVLYKQALGD
jgi:hypothetical protein